MSNPMLTLVSASCVRCGSTLETVLRDRELQRNPKAVCRETGLEKCNDYTFWHASGPEYWGHYAE